MPQGVQPSQSSCPELTRQRPYLNLPGLDAPEPKVAARLATQAVHDVGCNALHRCGRDHGRLTGSPQLRSDRMWEAMHADLPLQVLAQLALLS